MNKKTDFTGTAVDARTAMFAHRRAAIDLIGTIRARVIRAALFGAYLLRRHPDAPETEDTRSAWRRVLRGEVDEVSRICLLLHGTDPSGTVPDAVCKWLAAFGDKKDKQRAAFEHMRDLTANIARAAEAGDDAGLDGALNAHMAYGRGGFFELVTEFCDGMWQSLDEDRQSEVERAKATTDAIIQTLKRLEHIGKHVRLVSLNASVEAARVGDAGRGLGVIAVEFKTLAEEIQQLANTARTDIAALGGTSDHFAPGAARQG